MLIKCRGNTRLPNYFRDVFNWQSLILPEILVRLNQPYVDLKTCSPLQFSLTTESAKNSKPEHSDIPFSLGNRLVCHRGVPVLVYFFGNVGTVRGLWLVDSQKLWNPFSSVVRPSTSMANGNDTSFIGVLVFAVMTAGVLYTYFTGVTIFSVLFRQNL
jgi:hypothetical protein